MSGNIAEKSQTRPVLSVEEVVELIATAAAEEVPFPLSLCIDTFTFVHVQLYKNRTFFS